MEQLEDVFVGDEIGTGKDDLGPEEIVEPKGEEVTEEEAKAELEAKPKEKDDETPASKSADVPLAALMDERDKRQTFEKENAALREQLQANNDEAAEDLDPFEDFEGAFNAKANSLLQTVDSRFIDLTANLARSQHKDYDEMEAAFLSEAKTNPTLLEQMRTNSNPAEFAYQHAKSKTELEEAGDIDALKAKIRAEVEAELLGKSNKEKDDRESVPDSLSDARSAGKTVGKTPGGPVPLDSVFPGTI